MPDPTRKFLDDLHKQLNTLEKRLRYLETYDSIRLIMVHNTSYVLDNVTINDGVTNTTADLRGSFGIPTNANGVVLMVESLPGAATCQLQVDSVQAPDVYSPLIRFHASTRNSGMLFIALAADGQISFTSVGANISQIYAWIIGYWI